MLGKMLMQEGFGEIGLVWYFFVLLVALGRLLAGGAPVRRWTGGWRCIFRAVYFVHGHSGSAYSYPGHSGAGHSYPAYLRWMGLAGAGEWMLLCGRRLAVL